MFINTERGYNKDAVAVVVELSNRSIHTRILTVLFVFLHYLNLNHPNEFNFWLTTVRL